MEGGDTDQPIPPEKSDPTMANLAIVYIQHPKTTDQLLGLGMTISKGFLSELPICPALDAYGEFVGRSCGIDPRGAKGNSPSLSFLRRPVDLQEINCRLIERQQLLRRRCLVEITIQNVKDFLFDDPGVIIIKVQRKNHGEMSSAGEKGPWMKRPLYKSLSHVSWCLVPPRQTDFLSDHLTNNIFDLTNLPAAHRMNTTDRPLIRA